MTLAGQTPAMLQRVDRFLGLVARGLAALGGVAVALLVVVTVVSVFWRYVLHKPIFGVEDISSMALAVAVAGAVAWGSRQGSNVSVDVISFAVGRRTTRVTDLIARVLGAGVVALAAWALYKSGSCGRPCGAMTNNMGIPHLPFYYILSVTMGFYAALLLVQAVTGLFHWRGQDPNEVPD